jgi:hypothetical protein
LKQKSKGMNMGFAQQEPKSEFYTVNFEGKDLNRQCRITGVGWVKAWHFEDAAQQAMEPNYWKEGSIVWEHGADHVTDIKPVGIHLKR